MLKSIELVDLLEQYERFLVQYAVGVFRRIGDTYPAVESRLLGIIKGSVFPVPLEVFTRHLERLSDQDLARRKAAEAMLERYHLHREVIESVGAAITPELAREPLAEAAEKGEPSQRALALVTLAALGHDKARESLLAEFEGLPRPLRWGILILLEARHDVEWLPLFQANLEDAEPDVARIAIAAVGKTGTASASAKLQGLLSHGSEMIVIAAIQTLAQIRDPGAVPALKELARSTTSARIRATIMSAFGEFQDATTIGPLLEALDNEDPRTRANAILALKRRFLSQGSPDPAVIDRIKALLKDGDHRVRADAAQALWELGFKDSLPVIGGMLSSPAEADRTSGAYLCGKLKLSQFSDQLAALTDDRSWNVRKTASIALLGLGPSGLLILQTLMSHGTADEQVCAAYAAGVADETGAVDTLLAQSRSGSEMGEMATDLLLRLSKPAETRPEPEPNL